MPSKFAAKPQDYAERSFSSQSVQCEVQRHDVYARFAENAEVTVARALLNEFADVVLGKTTCFGDARDLQFRVRQADVRVEATAGGGHGIGGNDGVCSETVVGTVGGDILRDVRDQIG